MDWGGSVVEYLIKEEVLKVLSQRREKLKAAKQVEAQKDSPKMSMVMTRWDDYIAGIKDSINLIAALPSPEPPRLTKEKIDAVIMRLRVCWREETDWSMTSVSFMTDGMERLRDALLKESE
jgi:hypothetical protein